MHYIDKSTLHLQKLLYHGNTYLEAPSTLLC